MGNCTTKQWRLKIQQSCKNILHFSTCRKGEIIVQILSDNGKDLERGVLRSKQSSKLRWKQAVYKAAKALYPKIYSTRAEKWQHGLENNSSTLCINQHITTSKQIEYLLKV